VPDRSLGACPPPQLLFCFFPALLGSLPGAPIGIVTQFSPLGPLNYLFCFADPSPSQFFSLSSEDVRAPMCRTSHLSLLCPPVQASRPGFNPPPHLQGARRSCFVLDPPATRRYVSSAKNPFTPFPLTPTSPDLNNVGLSPVQAPWPPDVVCPRIRSGLSPPHKSVTKFPVFPQVVFKRRFVVPIVFHALKLRTRIHSYLVEDCFFYSLYDKGVPMSPYKLEWSGPINLSPPPPLKWVFALFFFFPQSLYSPSLDDGCGFNVQIPFGELFPWCLLPGFVHVTQFFPPRVCPPHLGWRRYNSGFFSARSIPLGCPVLSARGNAFLGGNFSSSREFGAPFNILHPSLSPISL